MTDATAPIGHNNPPEPTPYEAILTDVQDLSETAQGFLDGDPINDQATADMVRSEEHTSELQSLMRISYAVFCLKKKTKILQPVNHTDSQSTDKQQDSHALFK